MRTFIAFLSGAVAGAFVVYLSFPRTPSTIEARDEPAVAAAAASEYPLAAQPSGVPPPSESKPAIGRRLEAMPVEPALPGSVAIPVAGISRAQLKDHFDDARGGRVHRAIDIQAPRGTPVLAAIDGEVLKLFLSNAGGITLYQVDDSGTIIYYYAHLDGYAEGIAEKKRLRRGEILGYVGTTGNAPPNTPHLHFAIERIASRKEWWRGQPINPYPLLRDHGVTYTTSAAAR
jgi:murein DD-endopeptidase MepM/ murein hydrolase activator NlpD